jgi:hypothetical protein
MKRLHACCASLEHRRRFQVEPPMRLLQGLEEGGDAAGLLDAVAGLPSSDEMMVRT